MTSPIPPRVTVPPYQRHILRLLADLPDKTFDLLLLAIEDLPVATSRRELGQAIQAIDVPEISSQSTIVLDVLVGIHGIGLWSGLPSDAVGGVIADSVGLKANDAKVSEFAGKVARVLKIRVLSAVAKAIDVQTEHERLFHGARIFTDIRGVFLDPLPAAPVSAVLSHSLRIDFHSENGNDSLFVAMDESDLQALRSVIDRALGKAEVLERTLASAEPLRVEHLEQIRSEGDGDGE